jgi:GDPmannose 4,6-dehydratase
MFGNSPPKQSEHTPFVPRSPYGCAKLLAHSLCVNYRQAYGTKVSCGILFNHESPLRGREFVTQKIARGVWQDEIVLGNLEAKRDWGHAKDYVRAMWLMMQHEPDDFVIATGTARTVGEFLELAQTTARKHPKVTIDPKFYRPAEVNYLEGDASKAFEKLGWEPRNTFDDLVAEMVWEARNAQRIHRI